MISFGATPHAIGKIWEPSSQKLKRVGGNWPPNKPLAHIAETIIRQQLQPGQRLDKLQHVFLSSVHSSMTWDKMTSKIILPTPWTNSRTVSLLEWTREALLEGATTSFFFFLNLSSVKLNLTFLTAFFLSMTVAGNWLTRFLLLGLMIWKLQKLLTRMLERGISKCPLVSIRVPL